MHAHEAVWCMVSIDAPKLRSWYLIPEQGKHQTCGHNYLVVSVSIMARRNEVRIAIIALNQSKRRATSFDLNSIYTLHYFGT